MRMSGFYTPCHTFNEGQNSYILEGQNCTNSYILEGQHCINVQPIKHLSKKKIYKKQIQRGSLPGPNFKT